MSWKGECETMLERLMRNRNAIPFLEPVDHVAMQLPDYLDIIQNPMDLATVNSNLRKNFYSQPSALLTDVLRTFHNAIEYNAACEPAHKMAVAMKASFISLCKGSQELGKTLQHLDLKYRDNYTVGSRRGGVCERQLYGIERGGLNDSGRGRHGGESENKIGGGDEHMDGPEEKADVASRLSVLSQMGSQNRLDGSREPSSLFQMAGTEGVITNQYVGQSVSARRRAMPHAEWSGSLAGVVTNHQAGNCGIACGRREAASNHRAKDNISTCRHIDIIEGESDLLLTERAAVDSNHRAKDNISTCRHIDVIEGESDLLLTERAPVDSWTEMFERLKAFNDKNGHPHALISDAFVGQWVKEQRELFKAKILSAERESKLRDIGFVFDRMAAARRRKDVEETRNVAGVVTSEACFHCDRDSNAALPVLPGCSYSPMGAPAVGKRKRRPTLLAWGPEAMHRNNIHGDSPCCLTPRGVGCGLSGCQNTILREEQTELRHLLGVGFGVFAREDLAQGQWVGEYTGKMTVTRGQPELLKNKGNPTQKQLQYTLSGYVQNNTVTIMADGLTGNKRVTCHYINHACGLFANCQICWSVLIFQNKFSDFAPLLSCSMTSSMVKGCG
jgi:hypothetical protein